jgi:hypothetical protein
VQRSNMNHMQTEPIDWAAELVEVVEDTSRPGGLLSGATEKAIGQFLNA